MNESKGLRRAESSGTVIVIELLLMLKIRPGPRFGRIVSRFAVFERLQPDANNATDRRKIIYAA